MHIGSFAAGANMKKAIISICFLLILVLGLSVCSGENPEPAKTGQEPTRKSSTPKMDIDKMDIPERLKKAIKEGKIPRERIREILARQQGDAPLVEIKPVKQKSINAYLVLNGTVEPEKTVEVYSRLTSYTLKIIREEGDYVKPDDVLALLDDTEIRISYRQARLQLQQSEIILKDEEKNLKRNQELKKNELISEQDFQAFEANYKKVKIDFENNRENFKNLELQLSYTQIRSPVEGYVTRRLIEVGDRVTAGQQAYTIEDFSPLLIRVYVPTVDILNLKKGMSAVITTDVLKRRTFMGKIKLINPRIDVQSGTVKVTVEIFDKTQTLKPGMFVEVKITVSNNPRARIIPKKALVFQQNQSFVFVFRQGQVFQRQIKIGISEGDDMEVLEGLEPGEQVVVVGVESLKNGMKVSLARQGSGTK